MSKTKPQNHLLNLPVDLKLLIMTHLYNIYTLKDFLDAFPHDLYPIFQPYARSVLNAIFWRPMRRYAINDERGVVFRWMLREIHLEHLGDNDPDEKHRATTTPLPPVKYRSRTRPILCDDNDID